jgi:hypothetical protein
MYMAAGSATSAAIRTDTPEVIRCSRSRAGIPKEPSQCSGSVNHSTTSAKKFGSALIPRSVSAPSGPTA